MRQNVKVLITDLDGVIRLFPESRDEDIEKAFGLPRFSIGSAAFEPGLLTQVITGSISDREWREIIAKNLKDAHPEVDCHLAIKQWSDYPGSVEFEVLKFLKSQVGSLPLVLLTNATDRLEADLKSLGIRDYFDRIFNSSELGLIKPQRQLFEEVCEALKVHPGEAIFIDDSLTNVSAAQELGIVAHHYTGLGSLNDFLQKSAR